MGLNVQGTAGFHANYNAGNNGGAWYDGLASGVGGFLGGVVSLGSKAGGTALNLKSGGALGAASGAGSGTGNLEQLLAEQNRLQLEMQTFSMLSNISKTEHESRMNLVRNMRP